MKTSDVDQTKLVEAIKSVAGYESFQKIEYDEEMKCWKLYFDELPICEEGIQIFEVIAKVFNVRVHNFLYYYHYSDHVILFIYL